MKVYDAQKVFPRVLLVVLLGLAFSLTAGSGPSAHQDGVFALQAPSFVGDASLAAIGPAAIADEAGMSAWFQASTTISLDDVRGTFRTIETETADYIIGSVPVTNYPETEDVHVYVHVDGWILAYYLSADPVGKIFDWRVYHDTGRTNISTKLENTIAVVAGQAGVSFTGANHYDFRYPNATHMMLIVEWTTDSVTDSCEVNLPGSFAYYERGWSLGSIYLGTYHLDGVELYYTGNVGVSAWTTAQGTLTAAQLLPDQFHTIQVWGRNYTYGGLALVYRVP